MTTAKKMPKETLGELLTFIADNESFSHVERTLEGAMSVGEIKAALKDLALDLKREAASNAGESHDGSDFSPKTKQVLSCLSSYEEQRLLSAFGFTDKA